MPFFTREPFSLQGGSNKYLDMIVSRQANQPGPVPVAVVSKQYELVQHSDILDVIAGTLLEVDVNPGLVKANCAFLHTAKKCGCGRSSPFTSRMHFSMWQHRNLSAMNCSR